MQIQRIIYIVGACIKLCRHEHNAASSKVMANNRYCHALHIRRRYRQQAQLRILLTTQIQLQCLKQAVY